MQYISNYKISQLLATLLVKDGRVHCERLKWPTSPLPWTCFFFFFFLTFLTLYDMSKPLLNVNIFQSDTTSRIIHVLNSINNPTSLTSLSSPHIITTMPSQPSPPPNAKILQFCCQRHINKRINVWSAVFVFLWKCIWTQIFIFTSGNICSLFVRFFSITVHSPLWKINPLFKEQWYSLGEK